MTLRQFFLILRARTRIIFFALIGTVLIALAVVLILPRQYTASTAVVIDVKSPDPVAGMLLPGMISPSYMATQVNVATSDRVAQRAVRILRLNEDQAAREKWQSATDGKGDFVAWLAAGLEAKLEAAPARESNVINISYTAPNADFAAKVANAFAQAYIDVNLDLKVEPARQNAKWFDDQTRVLRDRLEAAQRALSQHQQKTGIVTTDATIDFETAKLNELSTQLTAVQAQASDSRSKVKPSGGPETLTEVIQNPLISALKTDVARAEARLRESSVNLGRNHPQTQRAESELASLRGRLASETKKIADSINTNYESSRQKESDLRAAIERQKAHILGLAKQRDEVSVLQRDVESAQRAFENVSQRASQARLESLSVQTNAVLLNPATVPTDPSKPKVKLTLLVAVFLGLLVGVGLALVLELMNRRVRSSDDVLDVVGVPVLATLGGTSSTPARRGFGRRRLPRPALAATNHWIADGGRP